MKVTALVSQYNQVMKQITIRVPEELARRVKVHSALADEPIRALMQRWIERGLNAEGAPTARIVGGAASASTAAAKRGRARISRARR